MNWSHTTERLLKLAVSDFLLSNLIPLIFKSLNLLSLKIELKTTFITFLASKSFDLADLVLPPLSLLLELDGRDHAVCRPELLLRLVERQQHRRVLEDVEPSRSQVVCPASIQTYGWRNGLQ